MISGMLGAGSLEVIFLTRHNVLDRHRSTKIRAYVRACTLATVFASTLVHSNALPAQQDSCSFDDHESLLQQDHASLDKVEVSIWGVSTEGGKADIYRHQGHLRVIRSVFYKETGRSEINYYFDPENGERYLVELTDYHYTAPIMQSGGKVSSISTSKFVVCEDQDPNYPNYSALADAYDRSVAILMEIQRAERSMQDDDPS